MKLAIHIGTNKTGSSFLQSTLISNKDLLLKAGIFLPVSRWDVEMLQGKITPGNGHQLANVLIDQNSDNLRIYLEEIYAKATQAQCHTVLLSNEILIRIFSDVSYIQRLEEVASIVGFNQLNYLCYLRNFYDHALSLFKHRSKYGKFDNYTDWFEQDYESLRVTSKTLEHLQLSKGKWSFVLYEKSSEKIIQSFEQWLGLSTNGMKHFPKVVNASLTLNQITWFRILEKDNTAARKHLYNAFIRISTKCVENEFLVRQFYDAAENYFTANQEQISLFQQVVSDESYRLLLAKPQTKSENYSEKAFLLSKDEFLVIRHILGVNPLKFVLKNKLESFKKTLASLRGKSKKKNQFDTEKFGGSLRN